MKGIEVQVNGKGVFSISERHGEVFGKGKNVGPAIAVARKMQGLSRERAAVALGIPVKELEYIEEGVIEATPETLLELPRCLNMRVEITIDADPEYTMSVKFKKIRGERNEEDICTDPDVFDVGCPLCLQRQKG